MKTWQFVAWLRAIVNSIDRRWGWALAGTSLIYIACTFLLASEKAFWNDELFTFYISRQPSFHELWSVLLTGAEQLPPMFFVITRLFSGLFGMSPLVIRLPEILGFWLMGLSLFWVVRKRSSTVYGLLSMIFPLVTGAFYYSFEARPYGLVLGFAGLAFVCWQAATEREQRKLYLGGLSLSLAGAISCHYYAVLVFIPFLLGECVRTVSRKRIDLAVWVAFLVSLIPLTLCLPLVRAASSYSSHFWARPRWPGMIWFYQSLLGSASPILLGIPILLAIYITVRSNHVVSRRRPDVIIPLHEVAAGIGFTLIPVLAMILAKTITGAFTDRYAMPAVIGVAVLLSWSLSVLTNRRGELGLLLIILALGTFGVSLRTTHQQLLQDRQSRAGMYKFLQARSAAGIPIIIAAPHLFFELSYRAELEGGRRFVYLADRNLALRYTDTDTVELGLIALKRWAPLNVQDFQQFCSTHTTFFVFGYPAPFAWLIPDLVRRGQCVTAIAEHDQQFLYRVDARGCH